MKQSNARISSRSAADSKHGVRQQRKPCRQSVGVVFRGFKVTRWGVRWAVLSPIVRFFLRLLHFLVFRYLLDSLYNSSFPPCSRAFYVCLQKFKLTEPMKQIFHHFAAFFCFPPYLPLFPSLSISIICTPSMDRGRALAASSFEAF